MKQKKKREKSNASAMVVQSKAVQTSGGCCVYYMLVGGEVVSREGGLKWESGGAPLTATRDALLDDEGFSSRLKPKG